VTFTRYPNGVDGKSFFEKRVPPSAPKWLPTVEVPRRSRENAEGPIEFAVISEAAALVWSANLAALELHVPLWRSLKSGAFGPFDLMVFDLDPGAPANMVDCCRVAGYIRNLFEAEGHEIYPKTSGSKGLQLYLRVDPPKKWEEVHEAAHDVAERIERDHRDEVVSRMNKDLRPGKVFIDWSQNYPTKTTIAAYSLRAREAPTASTPVTWEEVEKCEKRANPDLLRFEATDVLDRVNRMGDLFAPLAS
jgi:bifunctional non-homologous end joining protein LigD